MLEKKTSAVGATNSKTKSNSNSSSGSNVSKKRTLSTVSQRRLDAFAEQIAKEVSRYTIGSAKQSVLELDRVVPPLDKELLKGQSHGQKVVAVEELERLKHEVQTALRVRELELEAKSRQVEAEMDRVLAGEWAQLRMKAVEYMRKLERVGEERVRQMDSIGDQLIAFCR